MSWIQRANPGDKVVCVDDCQNNEAIKLEHVALGAEYTIRSIGIEDRHDRNPVVAIWLEGVRRDCFWNGQVIEDFGFRFDRFRPVEPRKTDISFAHEILRKATKQVEELA